MLRRPEWHIRRSVGHPLWRLQRRHSSTSKSNGFPPLTLDEGGCLRSITENEEAEDSLPQTDEREEIWMESFISNQLFVAAHYWQRKLGKWMAHKLPLRPQMNSPKKPYKSHSKAHHNTKRSFFNGRLRNVYVTIAAAHHYRLLSILLAQVDEGRLTHIRQFKRDARERSHFSVCQYQLSRQEKSIFNWPFVGDDERSLPLRIVNLKTDRGDLWLWFTRRFFAR